MAAQIRFLFFFNLANITYFGEEKNKHHFFAEEKQLLRSAYRKQYCIQPCLPRSPLLTQLLFKQWEHIRLRTMWALGQLCQLSKSRRKRSCPGVQWITPPSHTHSGASGPPKRSPWTTTHAWYAVSITSWVFASWQATAWSWGQCQWNWIDWKATHVRLEVYLRQQSCKELNFHGILVFLGGADEEA